MIFSSISMGRCSYFLGNPLLLENEHSIIQTTNSLIKWFLLNKDLHNEI
jgi:hypothetical protein